jgi:hypothetical protein
MDHWFASVRPDFALENDECNETTRHIENSELDNHVENCPSDLSNICSLGNGARYINERLFIFGYNSLKITQYAR